MIYFCYQSSWWFYTCDTVKMVYRNPHWITNASNSRPRGYAISIVCRPLKRTNEAFASRSSLIRTPTECCVAWRFPLYPHPNNDPNPVCLAFPESPSIRTPSQCFVPGCQYTLIRTPYQCCVPGASHYTDHPNTII